jgi:hypothetical protein
MGKAWLSIDNVVVLSQHCWHHSVDYRALPAWTQNPHLGLRAWALG